MVQYVNDHSATLGVAFNHCHVPGTATTTTTPLGAHEIELGMGIHNESGCLKTAMMPAKPLVDKMMTILLDEDSDRRFLQLNKGSRIVLMVNNLGGLPVIELNLVVKEAVEYLLAYGVVLERVYVGSFVTSLSMPGFSISVLVVEQDEHLTLLDLPTRISGWPLMAAQSFSKQVSSMDDAHKTKKQPSSFDASVGKSKRLLFVCLFFKHFLNLLHNNSGRNDLGSSDSRCYKCCDSSRASYYRMRYHFR
jgi:dihydroxyacetone kinase